MKPEAAVVHHPLHQQIAANLCSNFHARMSRQHQSHITHPPNPKINQYQGLAQASYLIITRIN